MLQTPSALCLLAHLLICTHCVCLVYLLPDTVLIDHRSRDILPRVRHIQQHNQHGDEAEGTRAGSENESNSMAERRRSGPVSNSFSDATSASGVGPIGGGGGDLAYVPSDAPVLMEGVLKKRGANLPVMRDRYCVATWEADPQTRAQVVRLRTYKNQKSYAKSQDKPVSSHVLKCFGEWDGKGNFHKYEHAFLMETDESKVFFCTAPTEAEKRRWIDVMKVIDSAENSLVESSRSLGGDSELKQVTKRQSSVRPSLSRGQSSNLRNERNESAAFQSDSDDDGLQDGEFYANGDQHSVTDSEEHSRDDGLFRSSSGAGSELNGLDGRGERASKAEPADWGIYGENHDQPTVSRYDVVDAPVVLLDEELLHEKADKAPLASDLFLFDDAGPSRFGAVMIKKKEGESDDDLADFVDEGLAARLEREKSEKILRKRVQKLESNRDLYAEMAAARLASMRKDARHPKKSPHESSFRPSQFAGDASDYYGSDDGYSHMTDAGHDPSPSEATTDLFEAERASSVHADDGRHVNGTVDDESLLYEDEEALRRWKAEKKRRKKERQALLESSDQTVSVDNLSIEDEGRDEEYAPEGQEIHVSYAIEREEEPVKVQRKKSKSKKPSRGETPSEEEVEPTQELLLFDSPESPQTVIQDEHLQDEDELYEQERRLEKQRRREERRARKEQQRQEEEEAAAAAAAELARHHREEMRAREEEKARKREKKERKERRERAKLDKEKKQRKAKEAELQAEVERLRLAQIQQKAEEEKKERKKKRRDKEKYSTPAERIHRKEKEIEAHAAEMSNALVLVETPAPSSSPAAVPQAQPASIPAAIIAPAPASAPTPAPSYSPSEAVAVAAPTPEQPQQTLPPPIAVSIPPSLTVQEPPKSVGEQQQPSPATPAVAPAPQSAPAYPMMPQYLPGYPAPPQSLPLYASSPYGAYQFPPQSYYPSPYANLAYPPVAPMTPQYLQPPLGYMQGPPPMMSQAYPPGYGEMPSAYGPGAQNNSSSSNDDEPAFIGPKLPSPKAQASALSSGFIGSPPPPPPSVSKTRSPSPALPDLPDLPDIADF
ncbi:hypothetical protein FI667_g8950, partial [Globisporangium splendens]